MQNNTDQAHVSEAVQLAQTIIAQLGGGRIFAMAFAIHTVVANGVALTIAPGLRRAAKAQWVRVLLTPADTYTVQLLNARGATTREVTDIYCDELARTVEKMTGLYLSL